MGKRIEECDLWSEAGHGSGSGNAWDDVLSLGRRTNGTTRKEDSGVYSRDVWSEVGPHVERRGPLKVLRRLAERRDVEPALTSVILKLGAEQVLKPSRTRGRQG
jgi:hypothetical protein